MSNKKLTISPDGHVEIELTAPLQSVDIKNILHIKSHEVTHEAGAVLHLIEFVNGGKFRLLVRNDGKIEDLTASNGVQTSLTKDDIMIISMDKDIQKSNS